jgi:hypothetical protein
MHPDLISPLGAEHQHDLITRASSVWLVRPRHGQSARGRSALGVIGRYFRRGAQVDEQPLRRTGLGAPRA